MNSEFLDSEGSENRVNDLGKGTGKQICVVYWERPGSAEVGSQMNMRGRRQQKEEDNLGPTIKGPGSSC